MQEIPEESPKEERRLSAAARLPAALALTAWIGEGVRGTVNVRTPDGECRLHLADGQLRLASDDLLCLGAAGAALDLEPLIALLGSAGSESLRLTPSSVTTPQGKSLPTAWLLMEAAARGRDQTQLWSQIGGHGVVFRMTGDSPLAREAMAQLEPRLQALLARFVKPQRAAELVGAGPEGIETLRDVARLLVVGLIAQAKSGSEGDQVALTDRSKELFLRRIAGELERRPLRINADEHRRQIGERLRNLGIWNHYQLLRVDRHQDEQAIHRAYVEVACFSHPSHAEKLGMQGKSAALDLLFEAATHAYLVLSHPDRRRAYDRDLAPDSGGPVSEDRRREKASVARDLYVSAKRMAMEQQFQPVLELMQQAVQLDPQAEYYKLLGDVQHRNPQWKAGALASYRDAVRCRPDDPDLRLAFARALEEGGDRTQAGIQYRAALELRPHDVRLSEALDDFENAQPGGKSRARAGRRAGAAGKGEVAAGGEGKGGGDEGGGLFPTFRALFRRGKGK